jgi:DNA-binding transcriptional MerR regulator
MNWNEQEKWYLISEVADLLGIAQNTLRVWEEKMGEAIHINRDAQGARYYTQKDIDTFKTISQMREKGLSLANIKEFLLILKEREGTVEWSSGKVEGSPQTEASSMEMVPSVPAPLEQTKNIIPSHQLEIIEQEFLTRLKEFTANLTNLIETRIDERFSELAERLDGNQQVVVNEITNLKGEVKKEIDQAMENQQGLLNLQKTQNEDMKKNVEQTLNQQKTVQQQILDTQKLIEENMAKLRGNFNEEIKQQLSQWAVITQDQYKEMQEKSDKKGFFGRLFGR